MKPTRLICSICQLEKPVDEFTPRPSRRRGYSSGCKSCRAISQMERRRDDPISAREISNKHRRLNREAINEAKREHYYKNAERLRQKQRAWNKIGAVSSTKRRAEKWPEKVRANYAARKYRKDGFHAHHWSYEHPTEVIYLTNCEHNLIHRHLKYNNNTMDYNDLNTFEKHYLFVSKVIARDPDYRK